MFVSKTYFFIFNTAIFKQRIQKIFIFFKKNPKTFETIKLVSF